MKKKYGLDIIIGKKSKLRFPHHVFLPKIDSLNFIIPANDAIVEPPLSTALTIKKVDPFDFCDQFNEESYDYEEGLPLIVACIVSVGTIIFEIKSPTTFALFGIVFDLEDTPTEKFRAYQDEIIVASVNFSLITLSPIDDFFLSDILSNVKSIYGSLQSYNCRRKYSIVAKKVLPTLRLKRYNHLTSKHLSLGYRKLNIVKHFINFTRDIIAWGHFPAALARIHAKYDIKDEWLDYNYLYLEDLIYLGFHDHLEIYLQSCILELKFKYLQKLSLNFNLILNFYQILSRLKEDLINYWSDEEDLIFSLQTVLIQLINNIIIKSKYVIEENTISHLKDLRLRNLSFLNKVRLIKYHY